MKFWVLLYSRFSHIPCSWRFQILQDFRIMCFMIFTMTSFPLKSSFLGSLKSLIIRPLWFSFFLCFIALLFWLLFRWFLFKFQYAVNRIVKGHVLYCNLPFFEMRFAVFWNVGSPYLLNCLIFNDIRFNVLSLPIFLFFVKYFVHRVFVNHSEIVHRERVIRAVESVNVGRGERRVCQQGFTDDFKEFIVDVP